MQGGVSFFGSMVKRRSIGRLLVRDTGGKGVPRTILLAKPTKDKGLPVTLTITHCLLYRRPTRGSTYKRYGSYGVVSRLTRPSVRFTFPMMHGGTKESIIYSRFLPR